MSPRLRVGLAAAAAVVTGAIIGLASLEPRLDRDWIPAQQVAPIATFDGRFVRIANQRAFRFTAPGAFTRQYVDRTYDLDKLESVSYVLTPFSLRWRGPAHSFVTFGFADSQFVSISVEARREVGEEYDILKGLFRRFELMYVIGDERDLIGQRAAFGDDRVYLYPVKAPNERVRSMFVAMLERANRIHAEPEFYNTATNNCTSNVVAHVNAIVPELVPLSFKTVLPGYSDALALKLELFDTGLPLKLARAKYRINARASRFLNDSLFSFRIRESTTATPAPERQ